jgi:[ribosomal protein S5]-alanine N-acetyltransferase
MPMKRIRCFPLVRPGAIHPDATAPLLTPFPKGADSPTNTRRVPRISFCRIIFERAGCVDVSPNPMIPTLETPRLFLRPLELADAPQIQLVFPQWEIVRHLNVRVPWPYPPDGALTFLRDVSLPAIARGEAWIWTIRPKSDPSRLIGIIDFRKHEIDNRGFWLDPAFHRQGLMTEAANAATDFWFEVLQFPVLRTSKAANNIASRRVSEKQGMRMIGTTERDYVAGRLLTERWEITAVEWRARKSAR